MTPTHTVVDADQLTLLVALDPKTPACRAFPVDLTDRAAALDTVGDLRRDVTLTLIGIEFEDPREPGSQLVITGDSLAAVTFTATGDSIPATSVLDNITELGSITVTEG